MTLLEKFYLRKDAAKLLGISVDTLIRLEHKGELRAVFITPNRAGYRESDLKRYIWNRQHADTGRRPT
jgi:excisionase family DNA binding protein